MRFAGVLLSLCMWLGPIRVLAQASLPPEAPKPPFESPKAPSVAAEKPWNHWDNKLFSTVLVFEPIADLAGIFQDEESKKQSGDQPIKGAWRAERVMFVGAIKFKNPVLYTLGWNFNGFEANRGERWSNMDVRFDIPVSKLGTLKVGRQKIGMSQEWYMAGDNMVFMERSSTDIAFIPQRNIGVMLTNTYGAKKRGMWLAGWFNDWFANHNKFRENGNQYTGRVSYLPVDRNNGDTIVQIASAVYYREAQKGNLRFRSRPEVNEFSYFIDTKDIAADHSTTTQVETTVIRGPNLFFGAADFTPVASAKTGNPFFFGWYAGASRVLTGERRSFNRDLGAYSSVKPRASFSPSDHYWGAIEVGGRFTYTDLTSGTIDGGRISRYTAAVSWYPAGTWRLEFNYGFSVLERAGMTGHGHGISGRIQWVLN